MIAWEWLQREIGIFATFEVGHYRPREHPTLSASSTRRPASRTGSRWMAELDTIKRQRIAGLMLRRDWGKHSP